MNKVPQNLTEANIKSYVRETLFKKGHPICPECKRMKYFSVLNDGRYFCSKCRKKYSLKQLAGFEGSKLTWLQIFHLIHAFSKNFTLEVAMDKAKVSYPTARRYYSILREKCKNYFNFSDLYFGGETIADETFIGKKKTNNQSIVIGVVKSDYTKLALRIIPDREQDRVEKFLWDHVIPSSKVITDGHQSYQDIKWMGYKHEFEIHEHGEIIKTLPIERIWALLKRFMRRTYDHVWKENLDEILVEFQTKFIHREIFKNPLTAFVFFINSVPTA